MRPGWIRTFTGQHVSLATPTPEMISPQDIAHHLALECRWAGATTRHYSVAEHSIWVARFTRELVPAEHRELATIHGLLHDAHEAYIKDIPTPLKVLLGDGYADMADALDVAIRTRFGLWLPSDGIRDAIKQSDKYASWCEAKALLAPCASAKGAGVEPPEGIKNKLPMISELRRPTSMAYIKEAFANLLTATLHRL